MRYVWCVHMRTLTTSHNVCARGLMANTSLGIAQACIARLKISKSVVLSHRAASVRQEPHDGLRTTPPILRTSLVGVMLGVMPGPHVSSCDCGCGVWGPSTSEGRLCERLHPQARSGKHQAV